MKTGRGKRVCLLWLLWLCWQWPSLRAQGVEEDPIGFGEIKLGAHIVELPIACLGAVVCEDRYESVWVRVWHADAQIRRVDVIYAGRESTSGGEIRSSPITLVQAIRTHSIRYGSKTPRLGFAGNEGPSRMIVDFANGICYLAGAVTENSLVTEVRYLPASDPLVDRASALPLYERGAWLVRAALLSLRYKNLLAEAEASAPKHAVDPQGISQDELAAGLMSSVRK